MSQNSVPVNELEPISTDLIKVGQSLPYNLYNPKGKFISAKEYIFKNEMEVSMVSHAKPMRLKTDGALHPTPTSPNTSAKTTPKTNSKPRPQSPTSKPTSSPVSSAQSSMSYGGEQNQKDNFDEFVFKRSSNLGGKAEVDTTKLTVVSQIERLIDRFPLLYEAIYHETSKVPQLLADMENQIFRIIDKDVDAAIGVIHISEIDSQAEHCVYAAILASIYARTIGYPNRFVRLVAAAALCMNLGAIKLHHQLNSTSSDLSEGLLAEIRKHSEASVDLMAKAEIRHPTINNAILYHHERPDGAGYPAGLHSQEIPDEALIIGIVDTYLAMIGQRAYRQKFAPKEALKQVLFEGHKYDNDFYTTFIRAIGVFPAGTFHQLSNGEVVVVVRRDPSNATKPQVCSLIDPKGIKRSGLAIKRLSSGKLSIKAPHPGGRAMHLKPSELWK
jgi:HD-GYP domain-containing protein (c-di-GMP phosphodiesterase class II)